MKEQLKKAFLNKLFKLKMTAATEKDESADLFRVQYQQDMLALENNLRTLVLSLLEKPVNLMRSQHESLELIKEIGRKN